MRVKELEKLLIKHKNLYYQGKPEISDSSYDQLEDELRALDPHNSVLEFVGSDLFNTKKIAHESKMLSLNKTYKLEELMRWKGSHDLISTFKIDGSSCSIVYEKGRFKIAKTRGDGKYGENISNKVLHMDHIPKVLTDDISCEIRGEIFCTEENFVALSKEMVALGFDKPTSQRNIVAGLLGRKENTHLSSYLSFQAFELIQENNSLETEQKKFQYLQKLGFSTPEVYLHKKESDIEQRLDETKSFMASGDYLIDGLVFSYNDLDLHANLGETAHHPRYKMAFKFQGDTKITTIKKISWQVSRNGILTPVANVEPIELSGAMVSRVTLHNFGMVEQHQLKAKDEIEIVRSGEVIPKFLSVVNSSKSPFKYPEKCPSCSEPTTVEDIRLFCHNDLCPDKIKDDILNYIKKIGIDDLSSKRLEELIKQKLVTDIPSLYDITVEQLLELDKVKEKLANKIVTNIQNSRDVDLITFLASLGISGGAFNKCEKVVMAGYDSIEKILKLSVQDLTQIESFAEKSAKEFIDSLQSKKETIKKLMTYGFSLDAPLAINSDSEIAGKKFCITGTLSMKRSDLQKIVKDNGGIVQSGVSGETDYLITNDEQSSSSKFKKAQSLNIPIISEEKFFKLIGK